MHRATWRTLGTVGIGIVAAFMVLGFAGGTLFQPAGTTTAQPIGLAGATTAPGNAPIHSLQSNLNNTTTLWLNITSMPALYTTLPAWVNWTVAVTVSNNTFTITPTDVSGTFTMYNELTQKLAYSFPMPIQTGVSNYSLELNASSLSCNTPDCSTALGTVAYEFNYAATANGTVAHGYPVSVASPAGGFDSAAFITTTPTFSLVWPTAATPAGNITLSVAYSAQYITAVSLQVSLNGKLVYQSSFFQSTPGISVAKNWYELTPGNYSYSIQGVTPYQTFYQNGTITVLPQSTAPSGGTVYQNATVYNNVTGGTSAAGYFGLSPPASGTVLLVVGLIVGIITGMVAGRMMMAPAPAKPAQPWSDTKTSSTNTCSVCGKSFGSAEELSAHAKSEHGMQ